MILLTPRYSNKLMQLIFPLDYHLILRSIINEKTPATIYVDRVSQSQGAFLWKKGKAWLLGSPTDLFIDDLSETLKNAFFPFLRRHGAGYFRLHYDERWSSSLGSVFHGLECTEYRRSYYHIDAVGKILDPNLPPGFSVVEIDEGLLVTDYENIDRVRDETVSERDSVEDFLEKSFGYAVMKGGKIVSWCMSEYNTGDRCELGIETIGEYQRKGLATQVARAVIGHAFRHGIHSIGWHCWNKNEASIRTALRIGFKHNLDYPISVVKIE
jgi:GNAT superfamily N-acetyltransferase